MQALPHKKETGRGFYVTSQKGVNLVKLPHRSSIIASNIHQEHGSSHLPVQLISIFIYSVIAKKYLLFRC